MYSNVLYYCYTNKGVLLMAKIQKNVRLDSEVIGMIEELKTLIPFSPEFEYLLRSQMTDGQVISIAIMALYKELK